VSGGPLQPECHEGRAGQDHYCGGTKHVDAGTGGRVLRTERPPELLPPLGLSLDSCWMQYLPGRLRILGAGGRINSVLWGTLRAGVGVLGAAVRIYILCRVFVYPVRGGEVKTRVRVGVRRQYVALIVAPRPLGHYWPKDTAARRYHVVDLRRLIQRSHIAAGWAAGGGGAGDW